MKINKKAAASVGVAALVALGVLFFMSVSFADLGMLNDDLTGDATRGTRRTTRTVVVQEPVAVPQPVPVLTESPAPTPVASCTDGIKNQAETDVDCGASGCKACNLGQTCLSGGNCLSGQCEAGTCAPGDAGAPCTTGAECRSGQCLSGVCGQGDVGTICSVDGHCIAGLSCVGGACVRPAPTATCTDGIKNQDESDVDCGGSKCKKCGASQTCKAGTDCLSGSCPAGTCGMSGAGQACSRNQDCLSGSCPAGTCGMSTVGQGCFSNNDCSGSVCQNGVCAVQCSPSQGQPCNRNQCGGSGVVQCDGSCSAGAPGVPSNYGQPCNCGGTIQCNGQCSQPACNGQCNNGVCKQNTCGGQWDARVGEYCGANCPTKCSTGLQCSTHQDCLTYNTNYPACMPVGVQGEKYCVSCGNVQTQYLGNFLYFYGDIGGKFFNLQGVNPANQVGYLYKLNHRSAMVGQNWEGRCTALSKAYSGQSGTNYIVNPIKHSTSSTMLHRMDYPITAHTVAINGPVHQFGTDCTTHSDISIEFRNCVWK